MRIITTLIGIITLVVVILDFCVITDNNKIYGQENNGNTTLEKTLYFQVEIPDDWTYQMYSDSYITDLLGFGPSNSIDAMPSENFGSNTTFATTNFKQYADYTIKNAPLDAFVKYMIDKQNLIQVTSQKDVIVANETATQIYAEGIGEGEGFKFLHYYLMHNKEPYVLGYKAFDHLYEKYLPDFEKMLKSFKRIDY
jgi:hypothetical protein